MGRQLFLHHYLPAHLASALVTGALVEFIFNLDPIGLEENFAQQTQSKTPTKNKDRGGKRVVMPAKDRQSMLALWAASGVILAVVIGGWWFFLPLTYGKPGLDPDQVNARKWLNYDLHFAK